MILSPRNNKKTSMPTMVGSSYKVLQRLAESNTASLYLGVETNYNGLGKRNKVAIKVFDKP